MTIKNGKNVKVDLHITIKQDQESGKYDFEIVNGCTGEIKSQSGFDTDELTVVKKIVQIVKQDLKCDLSLKDVYCENKNDEKVGDEKVIIGNIGDRRISDGSANDRKIGDENVGDIRTSDKKIFNN